MAIRPNRGKTSEVVPKNMQSRCARNVRKHFEWLAKPAPAQRGGPWDKAKARTGRHPSLLVTAGPGPESSCTAQAHYTCSYMRNGCTKRTCMQPLGFVFGHLIRQRVTEDEKAVSLSLPVSLSPPTF